MASDAPAPAWAWWTASPRSLDGATLTALERAAVARCGWGEEGLRTVARAIAARKLRGEPLPDVNALAAEQRAAGEPHPWARVWSASGRTLDADAMAARVEAWANGEGSAAALRRCGVAEGTAADGTRALVVVAVDALADLAPLPTRARTGQWLTLEARLRVPAQDANVVVLGPGGAPRTVHAWMDGPVLRARFAPEAPGEVTVQVVADVGRGPRPVLEATVFADVDPPARSGETPAPGEEAASSGGDDERLAAMLSAARASAGLSPLARDARLDAIARDHAVRMARAHALAHDAGDGDPLARLRAAGLDAREAAENVAHAPTVALAHRAIWDSPSHRTNVLRRDVDRVGIAVARDERGDAWVVEAMAGGLR